MENAKPLVNLNERDEVSAWGMLKYFKLDDNGCWIWQRSFVNTGYGQIVIHGKNWRVHRIMYLFFNGDIPKGHVIRHTCHNRQCGNPDHLITGTHKQNWKDSEKAHRESHKKLSKVWFIKGVKYSSLREASKKTGVHMGTIIKYTDPNGIFDYAQYLIGCEKANNVPRI